MRKLFAELIFWSHVLIILFWWGLFLISVNWWPDKISFHFHLSLLIIIQQFLWGFVIMPWTKEYRMVCIFTTITQILRGQDISNKNNYNHSFLQELFGKTGITIPHKTSSIITFAIMIIVTIQYLSL